MSSSASIDDPSAGLRLRSLARALHARLFASATGRIFAVRGRPEFAAVLRCLTKISAVPTAAEAPSPVELGIPLVDGELTPASLQAIDQALMRWRSELSGEASGRSSLWRQRALAMQRQEIAVLAGRLAACRQPAAEATYLLSAVAESQLQQALDAHGAAGLPWHDWLSRLVWWLAGPRATNRFLDAAAHLTADLDAGERTCRRLAAIAAAVACDGGVTPLPKWLVQSDDNYLPAALGALVAESRQPGFEIMLRLLDRLPPLRSPRRFAAVRKLLAQGCGADDLVWACEHRLWGLLQASDLRPGQIRRMADRFAERGLSLAAIDIFGVAGAQREPAHKLLVDRWLQWTDRWPAPALPPRLRQVLKSTFADCVLPALRRPWQTACVEQWLTAAAPVGDVSLTADPQACLAQIAACQRLLGQPPSISKSIQRLLAHDASRRPRQLVRAATAAAVMAAVDALRTLLRQTAEDAWRQATAIPLPAHSQACPIRLAGWLEDMDDAERQQLREVTAAWKSVGPGYKTSLAGNRNWLDQASAAGIDVAFWLQGETMRVDLGGQNVEIGLAADPRDVFLMGEYFRTCLSLGDSCQMSPLANAYDANKQVVLAVGRTARGKRLVVARQLIAINEVWQLIGYRCYRIFGEGTSQREACLAAMAEYCGRLARRSGLRLGFDGEPAELSTDLWLDDGLVPWHAAACRGWEAAQPPPVSLEPHVWLCLSV